MNNQGRLANSLIGLAEFVYRSERDLEILSDAIDRGDIRPEDAEWEFGALMKNAQAEIDKPLVLPGDTRQGKPSR